MTKSQTKKPLSDEKKKQIEQERSQEVAYQQGNFERLVILQNNHMIKLLERINAQLTEIAYYTKHLEK